MKKIYLLASVAFTMNAFAQLNPTPHLLPLYQNFGSTTFTSNPSGFVNGKVSGAPLTTQTAAQTSTASAPATLAPTTSVQTTGGSFGLANSGNGRMYLQHSASTTDGTNQLIMAINTLNWHNVKISFDVEMISANLRTAGLILQYRIGTTGAWTNIAGGIYSHSISDRINGQIDSYTNLALPAAAANQPVVQLRWATWRGTQTGNSSGIAVDNVNISASPQGLNTNVSASSAPSCSEFFISEYVHDTTVNRAIEIYNPTGSSKSLAGYYLSITTGTNAATYITLSGTVQSYSTFVVANAKAGAAILAKANQFVPNFNYSGNDVIDLVYSTNPMVSVQIIDQIGDPTVTTTNGFTVTALGDTGTTKNHTLTRLMNIPRGNLEWVSAQHEWYAHPVNTYGFLGWHSNSCNASSMPTVVFTGSDPSENIYNDIGVNTYHPCTFNVSITGTWSNQFFVYYDDTYNYTQGINFPLTCYTPTAASSDYSYPGMNYMTSPTSGSGAVSMSFTIQFDVAATAGDITSNNPYTYVYACFGLEPDPFNAPDFTIGSRYGANGYVSSADPNGIKSLFDNKQIKIYPNPFGNQIKIENKSGTQITLVTITDVMGREVLKLNPVNTDNISIDMSIFDRGIYFVKLNNNNDNFTVKMVKE